MGIIYLKFFISCLIGLAGSMIVGLWLGTQHKALKMFTLSCAVSAVVSLVLMVWQL